MRLIDTSLITQESLARMGQTEKDWVYNGLDCCVTLEVKHKLSANLDNVSRSTYEFSKRLQAPILEMNMRGVLIDQYYLSKLIRDFTLDQKRIERQFNHICKEGLGMTFEMGSHHQLKRLFYEVLKLPQVRKRNAKGQMVPTVDRNALEKLMGQFYAQPFISHILGYRDLDKKLQFLHTGIDRDGRLRTSFNIAGTTTGRLASNYSDFGSGTNLQNVERRLRRVIISDPGYKFCNIDLEQGDSRNLGAILGFLFHDWTYLDACQSGDLHTTVAKLVWPDMGWANSLKADRALAEQIFYRWFTFRDATKKLGHGTNYLGTPFNMSQQTKIPQTLIAGFQEKYFKAFPAIGYYHNWVRERLILDHEITTLFGRRRHFFGRADEATTIREAVAYSPQSMTAEEINTGLINVWDMNRVQCLLQVHDSILVQYPEEQEDELVPLLLKACEVPMEIGDRTVIVPAEAKVGWNWADVEYNKDGSVGDNPDGLLKYRGTDKRRRTSEAKTSILDRVVFRTNSSGWVT